MFARRQLQTSPAHGESQLRLLIYRLCSTHLCISKARKVFAAMPKYEQITQKLNIQKQRYCMGDSQPQEVLCFQVLPSVGH